MNLIQSISQSAFIQNVQGWELPLIVVIILLLFGGKKLPELARGVARAMGEFRRARAEAEETFRQALDGEDEKSSSEQNATPDAKNSATKDSDKA